MIARDCNGSLDGVGPTVAELLLERRNSGSKPGARRDGSFVSLVIEGGAMRGVVSAGMVAALEFLGLRDSFDAVYGASAGSIAGAYFVAGQARYGTTIFYENINNREFINISRLFRGKSIVSLEYLLDEVCVRQKPLSFDRVINSDVPLYVVAASLQKRGPIVLHDFETRQALLDAMRGSARIPFFAGPPVEWRGDSLLDASLYESIPFRSALASGRTTHAMVLLTRPLGDLRSNPGWIDRHIVAPYLRSLNPELAVHYLDRAKSYKDELDFIKSHSQLGASPQVLAIQTDQLSPKVSPFETNRKSLVRGAMDGFQAVYVGLGLRSPILAELITPIT